MNAAGASGLQLYNFGQTVSVPFFTETWRPSSFVERIAENMRIGCHTLDNRVSTQIKSKRHY